MQDHEEKLKKLGLTEYEIKVYITLLREGSLTGGKISRLSKVPHGRTYEVLINLIDKGLVSVLQIKPKIFKAISPKHALKGFINNKIEELSRLEKESSQELQKISKLAPEKEITSEKITVIWGTHNIKPMILKNYELAKKYVKIISTYEYQTSLKRETMVSAIKRGIKFYRIATKMSDFGLKMMKYDASLGAEVRYYSIEELRIIIVDGEKSQMHIVNPKNLMDRTFIEIQSKEFTKALEHYFDTIWKKAKIIK